jgi:hypothetical protein
VYNKASFNQSGIKMSEIIYDCWSANGEEYHLYDDGDFLDYDLEAGDTIYEATKVDYVSTDFIDAEFIVDRISDSAYEEAGEFADGWPNLSKDDLVELQKIIGNFIDSRCHRPIFWTVENVRERILTEDDFK